MAKNEVRDIGRMTYSVSYKNMTPEEVLSPGVELVPFLNADNLQYDKSLIPISLGTLVKLNHFFLKNALIITDIDYNTHN